MCGDNSLAMPPPSLHLLWKILINHRGSYTWQAIRIDTLTHILQEGGISLESLQTYKTEGSSSFAKDLSTAIHTSSKGYHYWWIVFFAPSAAAFVSPILKNYFELRTSQSSLSGTSELFQARVASIGPTTYTFLHDELHLEVDVTAQKPSPEDIVACITAYDRRLKFSFWYRPSRQPSSSVITNIINMMINKTIVRSKSTYVQSLSCVTKAKLGEEKII